MAEVRDLFPQANTRQVTQLGATGTPLDWAEGFVKSGLSSIPELVGLPPMQGVERYRQDSPIGGFLSQVAGFAVPYAGWYRASRSIRPLENAIRKVGNFEKAPFLTGAAREALRFAPFEAGRVGVSQVIGEEPFDEMLGDAAINLALGSGISGVLHGIAGAGRRATLKTHLPGVDIAAPLQLQLRQTRQLLSEGTLAPELVERGAHRAKELERDIRLEEVNRARGERYVAPIEGDKNLDKTLNRLMNTQGSARNLVRRRLVQGTRAGFGKDTDWREAVARAGLPDNYLELGQFFRSISFRTEEGRSGLREARTIDNALAGRMQSVGDNWFLAREEDGLYVMAKKVQGSPGRGETTDEWLLFKTDQPGAFAEKAAKWNDVVIAKTAWTPAAKIDQVDGGLVDSTLTGFTNLFPLHNWDALQKSGRLSKLLPKTDNEAVNRVRDAALEFLTPTARQFMKNARANWIFKAARSAYDSAETIAQEILYGRQHVEGKSAFWMSLRNNQTYSGEDNIRAIIESLDDTDVADLWRLWKEKVDPKEYAQKALDGEVTGAAARAAARLDQLDGFIWEEMRKAMSKAGEDTKKALRGHLGISRQWEGDLRIAIRDESGALRYVAAGPNRRAAQNKAKRVLEENPNWQAVEEYDLSQSTKLPADLDPRIISPGFLLERQNVRGFKWEDDPWTKSELLEAYAKGVRGRLRYQANLAVNNRLAKDLSVLSREDPVAYRIITSRINDMQGVQSSFGQWQNRMADQILAPMLGTNSASKIVQVTNTAMHTLQLGMGKISYPLVNALTFPQTVLPEIAMVMNAVPEDLAGRYMWFAAGGSKGPVGAVGVIDPMKLLVGSFREFGSSKNPQLNKLMERAINERVIHAQVVEDYFGEAAVKAGDLRKAFSSGGDFASWVRALSDFLPTHSERFSRGHAFTVGYMLARDFLRLTDEDHLFRFAKDFTENTMYMYGAADRARIFTTPIGSSLGLFKTWMMNYIHGMLEYTGQGLTKGNWSPLLWQTAGTMTTGGLAATPLYWIANGFSNAFSDKALIENTYEMFGEEGGNAFMYGLPTALGGISLYNTVQTPAANPARDASMLWSAATIDRLKYTSQAFGAAFDHWQVTGEHPGRSQRVMDQMARAFAPVTVYRAMATSQDGLIRSLGTGYPMLQDVSFGQQMLFAFGLNPVELDRAMEISNQLYSNKQARFNQVQKLGKAFQEAQAARDTEMMRRVLRQAMVWGVDVSSVLKSAMSRGAKAREDMIQRSYNIEDIMRYRHSLPGFGG